MTRPVLTRRDLILAASAAIALPVAASAPLMYALPAVLEGTFLQIWPTELSRSEESWHGGLYLTRLLGCTEITIQWLNYGPGPGAYEIPDALIGSLLDYAAANTLSVRLGLPYDYRYWDVLSGRTNLDLTEFLTQAAHACNAFIGQSKWGHHRAFAGWYLPYEIEQHSWRYTSDAELLIDFLAKIAGAVAAQTLIPLAVSTFSSKLDGGDTLAVLWQRILDRAELRPMVQDGVGSAGIGAYRALDPLFATLTRRDVSFDVVIELFQEQRAEQDDGSKFDAVSASYDRVWDQMTIASRTGADRLLGFAIDPYMLGYRPGAGTLLDDYRAGLNARSRLPPDFAIRRGT